MKPSDKSGLMSPSREGGTTPAQGTNPRTTARFWVNYGGGLSALVKIRKGESFSHVDGGLTDEGFDYTARTWTFDGDEVTVSWVNNARDCDGPISRYGTSFCPVADLQDGYRCPDDLIYPFAHNGVILPIIFPKWRERGRSWQRDTFAEAAGY